MKKVIIYALVALGVFTLIISNLGTCSWGGSSTAVSNGVDGAKEVLTDVESGVSDDENDSSIDESDFDDEDGDYDIDDSTSSNDEDNATASTDDEESDSDDEVTVAGDEDETDVVLATGGSSDDTASSSSSTANTGSTGKFLVVTGSFRMKENAEALAKKLRKRGYTNAEVVIFDYSEYYSVVAGRSNSQSTATSLKNDLNSDGIESYVHKMRSKYFK